MNQPSNFLFYRQFRKVLDMPSAPAKSKNRTYGFTIVELLIVIVIIGILAAITIVAYNGIQQRSRDSARSLSVTGVQKAIELYRIDNGVYPSVGSDNSGYDLSTLSAALVPKYINSIPTDPNTSLLNYQYVRGPATDSSYAIRISYEGRSQCHRGVADANTNWWGLPAC